MAKGDEVRTQEQLCSDYVEKTALLVSELGDCVSAYGFYREIFPPGCLQESYRANPAAPHNGDYVAIANVIYERKGGGGVYRRNQYVTDELTQVGKWVNQVAFMAPCSFLGGSKSLANLRYLHAFVVDLDYVGAPQLRDVFHQCRIGFLPTPTFIVNSGTGLHLYYVLDEPMKVYPNQYAALSAFKHALIDLCWNEYTSQSGDRQYSGLVQPYRMPGTRSKLDVDGGTQLVVSHDYPVLAWRFGDKWALSDLLAWEPRPDAGTSYYRQRCEGVCRMLAGEIGGFEVTNNGRYIERGEGRVPLADAKEKWPEWYDRRILHNEPPKSVADYKWHVNPRVYEWWLRKISEGAQPGHRYHCVFCLAVYAIKCDVPWERLRADAYALLPVFEGRTNDEKNHFLQSDVDQALRAYRNKGYATLPIGSIECFSGLRIDRNQTRKGRPQAEHLAEARLIRDFRQSRKGSNWWDNGNRSGAPTKAGLVRSYAAEHPEANHSEIARALGVSRPTVIKWLSQSEHTD